MNRNADQVLSAAFREADGTISAIHRSADQVLDVVYDESAEALKVSVSIGEDTLTEVLAKKIDKRTAITAGTKTKVTYGTDGLITAGADATTADIADSADKRYCTDAEKTILTNQATVTTLKVCVSMADNAIITLPTCPNGGFLKVCTATGQAKFFIPSTGIPEYESYYSAVFALTSTAGKIGVFQVAGQNYACIENKTGGAIVVTYELEYGVVA